MGCWREEFTNPFDHFHSPSLSIRVSLHQWLHSLLVEYFMSGCYQVSCPSPSVHLYQTIHWLFCIALYLVIFLPDDTSVQPSHKPTYGQATAFFVWNSIIIALEYSIGGAVVFQVMRNNLPPTVLSLFVSLTALPMAHWFTHDYVKSDFFHDGQIAFPMLVLKK